ncbi:DUF5334 family protein [Mycoplana dimorpha]|nr:DUF5334 family protein [Mycoplana dimorpha]
MLTCFAPAFAWDGIDTATGGSVEIGKGNLVRSGRDIEIYDVEAGEYREVEVQSIREFGGAVEVEIYDHSNGEYRVLEMED